MTDHDRVKRWLLGLAERQVTASGSRATFTSDMYFEAAESIEQLSAEIANLKAELEEAQKIIEDLSPLAMNSLFLKTNSAMFAVNDDRLTRARAFLKKTGK